jgi:hypothetical protein
VKGCDPADLFANWAGLKARPGYSPKYWMMDDIDAI